MNSADRSIALVDYALRRRFYFVEMLPNENLLTSWLEKNEVKIKEKILRIFIEINKKIVEIDRLGKHFQLGHTYYFVKNLEELNRSWKYAIYPLLEVYLFGEQDALNEFESLFNKIINE